jgi:hypothetical protein
VVESKHWSVSIRQVANNSRISTTLQIVALEITKLRSGLVIHILLPPSCYTLYIFTLSFFFLFLNPPCYNLSSLYCLIIYFSVPLPRCLSPFFALFISFCSSYPSLKYFDSFYSLNFSLFPYVFLSLLSQLFFVPYLS